jgi:hypothetical protein
MKTKLWRLGDSDYPETSEALDNLLALRLAAGITHSELVALEHLFVSLHGSSAWGRLLDYLIHRDGEDNWYFATYRRGGVWQPLTGSDIFNASSVEVVEEP